MSRGGRLGPDLQPCLACAVHRARRACAGTAVAVVVTAWAAWSVSVAATADEPALIEDFVAAAAVFVHPRCANCHAAGAGPTQGESMRPHSMHVVRGPAGVGVPGARCQSCHTDVEVTWSGAPPAAPHWRMPPPTLPMVFAGRSPAELCRQLKDPAQTGRPSLAKTLEHALHDPLVAWAFEPGGGREPPPLTRAAFLDRLGRWARDGAPCPGR